MNLNKALIFNIQRFSLNDGNGIRTIIFFKGCPLNCPWCSNPESQFFGKEMMRSNIYPDMKKEIGKWYSIDEIISEVLKDEIFYNTSKGGVTLSGGEVLMQMDIATKLLKELKENGIHTTIETCGQGDSNKLKIMLKYVDEVLFDLKIVDKNRSKQIINSEIDNIIENLKISNKISKVVVRFPYIPGYTDDEENITAIVKVAQSANINEIHILPYHNYGSSKYELLDKKYLLDEVSMPSEYKVEHIKNIFEFHNFRVLIGG